LPSFISFICLIHQQSLSTRVEPWKYSKAWYKRRNEIERLFRRLKGFRRIFSRFDKLDLMFMAFFCFALVVEALR
jgi:transposase